MDTLEWPEGNSDKATVGLVVCTVYMDGQPYKPCVLCETGLRYHANIDENMRMMMILILLI